MTILHFSHANGFPAACYRKMFSYLEPGFEIGFVNTIGHDPRHPVTDSWPHLVAELIERLERYREPVLRVGHSLGGYLTALEAMTRGRRAEWASSDEAYAHFRNKRTFRNFDTECLRDYATLGMQPSAGVV